jgi:hypothetical protein
VKKRQIRSLEPDLASQRAEKVSDLSDREGDPRSHSKVDGPIGAPQLCSLGPLGRSARAEAVGVVAAAAWCGVLLWKRGE